VHAVNDFMGWVSIALFVAALVAAALLLTDCVIEPIGPYGYGHPRQPAPYYNGWRY
jgi:hypothetical protein